MLPRVCTLRTLSRAEKSLPIIMVFNSAPCPGGPGLNLGTDYDKGASHIVGLDIVDDMTTLCYRTNLVGLNVPFAQKIFSVHQQFLSGVCHTFFVIQKF